MSHPPVSAATAAAGVGMRAAATSAVLITMRVSHMRVFVQAKASSRDFREAHVSRPSSWYYNLVYTCHIDHTIQCQLCILTLQPH